MYQLASVEDIKKLPVLNDGSMYLYVLKNDPQGYVKVGVTKNFMQRLHSLSGSNGGGNRIIHASVSEPTWLYSLEHIIHDHFKEYRVEGTEWFSGITPEETEQRIDMLFASEDYTLCNETRRAFYFSERTNKDEKKDEEKK